MVNFATAAAFVAITTTLAATTIKADQSLELRHNNGQKKLRKLSSKSNKDVVASAGKSSKSVAFHYVQNVATSNVWSGSAQSIARAGSGKSNKSNIASVGGVSSGKSSKTIALQNVHKVATSNGWPGSAQTISIVTNVGSSKSSKLDLVENVATSNVWYGSGYFIEQSIVGIPNSGGHDEYYKDTFEDVRAHIAKLVADSDRELIPKFLRLGFHDCIGGCDGCVDLNNMDNKGLDEPIDAIYPIVEKFKHSFSRADIWAMATLVSADLALVEGRPAGLQFPMRYIGRKDCEGANAKGVGGPELDIPSNHVTTHELLDFFSEKFNFDAEETVIIMGVHAVATVHRNISGFGVEGEEFGWVFDAEDYVLDNRYYKMLVGDDDPVSSAPLWQGELVHNEGGIPSRYQWFHEKYGEPERPIMTSADIGLVRDLSDYMHDENGVEGIVECVFKEESVSVQQSKSYTRQRSPQQKPVCPVSSETLDFMIEYKMDNELWLIDFERVLEKMLTNGYETSE